MIGTNAVKAKLREGGVSLGSFCLEFRTPGMRPAAFDDSEFSDALARVAQVATANGKAAGYLALSSKMRGGSWRSATG